MATSKRQTVKSMLRQSYEARIRIEAGKPKRNRMEATPSSILDEAKEIIYGDREKTYGSPAKNLNMIAELWGAYHGVLFTAEDVCNMMILLKVARLANDPRHRDSQIDLCGYAALMERIQK
jgi:hypothetical protein